MRRSPFVAAVLAATVIASTLVASAPPGVAGDDEPGLVPTRVVTDNFRAERPPGKFRDAIDESTRRSPRTSWTSSSRCPDRIGFGA